MKSPSFCRSADQAMPPIDMSTRWDCTPPAFDLSLSRQAIVVETAAREPGSTGSAQASALRLIRDMVHDPQDISCSISSTSHVVLRRYDDARNHARLAELEELADRMTKQPGWTSPYDIEDLRVEQLVSAVPGRLTARLSEGVLGPLRSTGDWPATRATVLAWVESGFVLVEAARVLTIHRNTLVYRLQRISTVTGRPTTDRRAWLVLYLACTADSLTSRDLDG